MKRRRGVGRSAFEPPTRPEHLPQPRGEPGTAGLPRAAPDLPPLDPAKPPAAVRLVSPFAFVGEDGAMQGWLMGQVVSGAEEVVDLIRRGAPLAALGLPAPVAGSGVGAGGVDGGFEAGVEAEAAEVGPAVVGEGGPEPADGLEGEAGAGEGGR